MFERSTVSDAMRDACLRDAEKQVAGMSAAGYDWLAQQSSDGTSKKYSMADLTLNHNTVIF
jgi:hypothetical protein